MNKRIYTAVVVGNVYGRWKIIGDRRLNKWNRPEWLCECQCESNKRKYVLEQNLKNGLSLSCGCLHKEIVGKIGKLNKEYNRYDFSNKMGIGYTNKEEIFIFNRSDIKNIELYCWSINKNGYLEARDPKTKKLILMHRLILGFPSYFIDHKNKNKLDNRRSNLRKTTNKENCRNAKLRKDNKTGFTGVIYREKLMKWVSSIKVDGVSIHLGTFDNIRCAVIARLSAERKYFGDFAPQNYLFREYGII